MSQRGYEISQSFLLRMRNFSPALLEEKVRVRLAGAAGDGDAPRE